MNEEKSECSMIQAGEKKVVVVVVVVEGQMEFIESIKKRTGEKATDSRDETRQAQSSLAS